MGTKFSKNKSSLAEKNIILNITTPFEYNFCFDSFFYYNNESYYKFIAKKPLKINSYRYCNLSVEIENKIYLNQNISLDITTYKEIIKNSKRYYEIEYNKDKVTIFFRINSKNLTLKECVVKVN
jgi:hypothetical protein